MHTERFDVTDLLTGEFSPARMRLSDLADGILFTRDEAWREAHRQALKDVFDDKVRALTVDYASQRVYAIIDTQKGYVWVDVCELPLTHMCFTVQQPVVFPRSGRYN